MRSFDPAVGVLSSTIVPNAGLTHSPVESLTMSFSFDQRDQSPTTDNFGDTALPFFGYHDIEDEYIVEQGSNTRKRKRHDDWGDENHPQRKRRRTVPLDGAENSCVSQPDVQMDEIEPPQRKRKRPDEAFQGQRKRRKVESAHVYDTVLVRLYREPRDWNHIAETKHTLNEDGSIDLSRLQRELGLQVHETLQVHAVLILTT